MSDLSKAEYPVDSKYSWLVAILACMIYAVTLGVIRSLGIILVEMKDYYSISESDGMWILSTTACMILLAGPTCGVLLSQLDLRQVLMMGFSLLSASLISAIYVPTYHYLFICFFFIGVALNYMFLTCLVTVSMYFEKRRATAIGVASAGAGIGTFFMPPLIRLLFDKLSFQQCIFIVCAIVMQLCVPTMFIRPRRYWKKKKEGPDKFSLSSKQISDVRLSSSVNNLELSYPIVGGDNENNITLLSSSADRITSQSFSENKTNDKLSVPQSKGLTKHNNISLAVSVQSVMLAASELDLSNLPDELSSPDKREEITTETNDPKLTSTLRRLFSSHMFIVFLISNYLMSCGAHLVFTLIPLFGEERGVSKYDISLVLSVGGVVEIVARLVNGYLANRHYISALTQLGLAVVAASLNTLMLASWGVRTAFYISGALYGIFLAPIVTLVPIVLLERFDKSSVSIALGISYGIQGAGVISSYGITPYLHTLFGTWRASLYYMSVCMIVGGLIQIIYSLISPSTRQKYLACRRSDSAHT